jgi:hypothetical protein
VSRVVPAFLEPRFDLDALETDASTFVAVDRALTIQWVNPAWDRFARANGGVHVPQRYGRGRSYLDGITAPLRAFYEAAFVNALTQNEVFAQTYECSSPTVFRVFRVRALPCDGEGLLLEHSTVVDRPHDGDPASLPLSDYTRPDGTVLQCSNCRRVQRAKSDGWDWVPAWVSVSPPETSHGLCGPCSAFYWGVK